MHFYECDTNVMTGVYQRKIKISLKIGLVLGKISSGRRIK
jgi:hypothetical protein